MIKHNIDPEMQYLLSGKTLIDLFERVSMALPELEVNIDGEEIRVFRVHNKG